MNTIQNLKISNLSNFKKYSSLYLKLNKKDWKNSTYQKNKGIVKNRLSYFNEFDIQNIKVSDIRLWLSFINDVSNKSKKHYLSSLSMIFDIALQDELISKNPIIHLKKLQHTTPKIKPFTDEQTIEILRASKKYNIKFQLFLKIGFFTGMRTGEIISLKIKEIDLKNKIISINSTRSRFGENKPKTIYSIRNLPILNNFYEPLKDYIKNNKNNKYLFETQYHKPYRDTNVFTENFYKPILKSLKIPYRRIYNMRHTYATQMLLKNYVTPLELSRLLGHSSPKMVYDVYVNYINSNLKDFDRNIILY